MAATAIQPDYDKELIAYLTKLLGITQNMYISPAIRKIFNENVNNFLTNLILTRHSSAVTSLALEIVKAEIARLKPEQPPQDLEDKRILISDNLKQATQREAAASKLFTRGSRVTPSPSYNTQRAIEPFRITRDDDNKGLYAYLTELSTKQHKPVVISTALEIVNTEMITKLEREGTIIPQILKDTHATLATAAAAALEILNTEIAKLIREQKLIPQPIPQILKDHARLATAVADALEILNTEIATLLREQKPIPQILTDIKARLAMAVAAALTIVNAVMAKLLREGKLIFQILKNIQVRLATAAAAALTIVNAEIATLLREQNRIPQILTDIKARLAMAAAAALTIVNAEMDKIQIDKNYIQILKDTHAKLATAVAAEASGAAAAITLDYPSLPGRADDDHDDGIPNLGGSRRVRRRNKHGQRVKSRRSSSHRRRRRRRTIQRRF